MMLRAAIPFPDSGPQNPCYTSRLEAMTSFMYGFTAMLVERSDMASVVWKRLNYVSASVSSVQAVPPFRLVPSGVACYGPQYRTKVSGSWS